MKYFLVSLRRLLVVEREDPGDEFGISSFSGKTTKSAPTHPFQIG